MQPLRIIYTPNADGFRLRGVSACFPKYKGDPETNVMRGAYGELRRKVPDQPVIAGVASFDEISKQYGFRMRKEMERNGIIHMTTTYFPLDIMDAAIRLKGEDM